MPAGPSFRASSGDVLSGKNVVQLMPLGPERLTEVVAVALMDSAPERLFEVLTDVESLPSSCRT